jgi:acetylornithine deacetylase/succinyl-diaminopimelate desuccinylase-like protein
MKSNGGSDARYLADYDIPTLITYPTGGGRHSDDEWLEVKSFYQFRDVLQDYLAKTARLAPTPDENRLKPLTSVQ